MKFLVMWKFQENIRTGLSEVAKIISNLQDYAKELQKQGKRERYYHVVGVHGGAWIFDVQTNEELETLLARMPVYNYASYRVYPLSDMAAVS